MDSLGNNLSPSYVLFVFSEKSAFEYGLVNHALSAAMRTLVKVWNLFNQISFPYFQVIWQKRDYKILIEKVSSKFNIKFWPFLWEKFLYYL